MKAPLLCDVCGEEVIPEDKESKATVISDGDDINQDAEFFVAVKKASMRNHKVVIDEADAFCSEHTPEVPYEYP